MQRPAECTERVVQRRTDRHAHQYFGRAEREFDFGDQRVEDDAERHHSYNGLAEDFAELQCAKQRNAHAADRAEQTCLGDRAANAIADEGHDELEHAHHHHHRHADLPGEDRRVGFRHS
jgi:hypothetical protein